MKTLPALPALVVFDLAGTTIRDRGEVPGAFVTALAEHGLEVDAGALAAMRGASKRQVVRDLVPAGPDRDALAAAVYSTFRRLLADRFETDGVAAVEGATEVFSWLRVNGVRAALTTGFDRPTTAALLDALGWDQRVVDATVSSDEVAVGRPAPDLILAAMERTGVTDAARVATVGDTARDLEAGNRAGVKWNVGVLSGAHDRATLERSPHTHIVSSVADLPAIFVGDRRGATGSTR